MGLCSSKDKIQDENEKPILTEDNIENIKRTWKIVLRDGLSTYGTNLMMRILVEHKELKPLWRFSRGLETAEQMSSNELLKAHGEKILNAIDLVIRTLDDISSLEPILLQLGYGHFKLGVKVEYFPYIGESLIGVLQDGLKSEFNQNSKDAWLKLFEIIRINMSNGIKKAEIDSKSS